MIPDEIDAKFIKDGYRSRKIEKVEVNDDKNYV